MLLLHIESLSGGVNFEPDERYVNFQAEVVTDNEIPDLGDYQKCMNQPKVTFNSILFLGKKSTYFVKKVLVLVIVYLDDCVFNS